MRAVTKPSENLFRLLLPLACLLMGGNTLSAQAQQAPKSSVTEVHGSGTPDWKTLQAPYEYDAYKKPVVKTEEKASPNAYVLHIDFTGPSGDKVTGLYVRPKKEGVYPCILMMHGWTSKKEDMALWIGLEIVAEGMSFLALDAPQHGERAHPGGRPSPRSVCSGLCLPPSRDNDAIRVHRLPGLAEGSRWRRAVAQWPPALASRTSVRLGCSSR